MNLLEKMFGIKIPAIGVVHLAPLPGTPLYKGDPLNEIAQRAVDEATSMVGNGINGLIIENFGDKMFLKRVGPETVASMTYIAGKIKESVDVPIGLCVLQSDPIAGIAICKAIDATFVRIPYYTETYIVDTGLMESVAAKALRYRKYLEADVKFFVDVHIKHGFSLHQRSIEESAEDAHERGLADAIIVTGKKTGGEAKLEDVVDVRKALPKVPLIVGSGVSKENLDKYFPYVDGVIISTSLRVDGKVEGKLDIERVLQFTEKLEDLRQEISRKEKINE